MFIEIALDDLSPAATMSGRLLVAAVVLSGVLVARRGPRQALGCVRQFGRAGLILGAVSTALPFWLIAWGQTHIDSGIAAIGNAAMPIFVALLAIRFAPGERVTGFRAVGIVLGILGVGVLVGVDPAGGLWGAIGTLAAIATLGIGGTAIGLLLYIHLVESHGSSRASLVVYLLPVIAVFYGAVFLDEPVRVTALAGLALILSGVALGSGLVRPLRRQEAVPAPSP